MSSRVAHTISSRLALLFVLLFAWHTAGEAQVANGSITGILTDSTGAIVPSAHVTLTKTDTGLTLQTQTNNAGIYTFSSLLTGPYRIQVIQPGFKKAETTLQIAVGQTVQIDLTLEVGSSNESITIEAAGLADLETSDSTIGYTVGERQIQDLPLNGRNPYGLASLSPGINPGGSFGQGVSQTRGAVVR